MSFQYSSSNNGFLGIHGDRLPQGRLRWVESNECSSSTESRRSSQFGGQLKIKQEEISNDEASAMFSQNSVVEQGARCAECPASPSPVCSPVTTSPALSPHQINGSRSVRCRGNRQYADSSTEGSIVLYNGNQSRGKEPLEASAGVAGSGPSSARSDNASFGVLPANLSSNRESKPISENPEEENDGVRDIHVTLERTRAAAASNETRRSAQRRQHNWSDTSMGSFVSSDTESISLSTEFNNVLAAAAAATSNSSAQALDSTSLINLLNENSSARSPAVRSTRLPGIGEEEPTRSTSEEAGDRNEGDANNGNGRRDNMALVPTSTTAAEGNREQRNAGRDYFALVPIDGAPESTGSTSDRDAPQSSWDAQHNEGAIVESGNANGDNTDNRGFGSSTSSIRSGNENRLPTTKQLALQKEVTLQKVKKDKIEAKAVAWEEAKLAKVDNRFKREETIIEAWENEQKVKANIKMKKVERKLEEKRATAFEKMQNEIAKSHRKAENRRAVAEARRGSAKAKIAEVADKIRSLGKLPRKFIFF
uniref:Remorin C-terminal domain-containing protein n=1 Tax=Picea sitchensis TaxID=3332 RepID=B8LQK7_PICSI|nr:unknown [Picea sitchensis]